MVMARDFACPPQIHSTATHLYKHIGNNVTISCPVTGYPQPLIMWMFENSPYDANDSFQSDESSVNRSSDTANKPRANLDSSSGNSSLESDDHQADLGELISSQSLEQMLPSHRYSVAQEIENHMVTSVLTVHGLQPIDTQRITCYARNSGGFVTKNFTLIVSTQEPFSSSRSMDFIVTEMFMIFLAISLLLVALLIFVTIFIAKFKKRSYSHHHVVHSADNAANGANSNNLANNISAEGNLYVTSGYDSAKPPLTDLCNINDKCLLLKDGSVHLASATNHAPVSMSLISAAFPNGMGNSAVAHGILMMNQMDMMQSTGMAYSDVVTSTDLSSQSTTNTSVTVPCPSNGPSPNTSCDSTNHPYFAYPNHSQTTTEPIALISNGVHSAAQFVSYPHAHPFPSSSSSFANYSSSQQVGPDALSSTYLVTSSAPINNSVRLSNGALLLSNEADSAYPLLNAEHLPNSSGIYGTRIAPTRLQSYGPMPTSMSYHEMYAEHPSSVVYSNGGQGSSDKTKFTQQDADNQRVAFTYATIRKRTPHNDNANCINTPANKELRPLTDSLRNVVSYPEGFSSILVESNVDSGEPIKDKRSTLNPIAETTTSSSSQLTEQPSEMSKADSKPVDALDERDEDDYYRTMNCP